MKSPIQLQDLVSDHQFEMWLSKFLEMEHIPHYLNQFLRTSPSVQQLCQYIATSTLEQKLPKLLTASRVDDYHFEWQHKLKNSLFYNNNASSINLKLGLPVLFMSNLQN